MNCVHKFDGCTGCSACYSVCPNKSITMKADEEGFLYPEVGTSCIGCGKCTLTCPVQHQAKNMAERTVYAGYSRDDLKRKSGSSGGTFGTIAEWFIREQNAVIFGACFDDKMNVIIDNSLSQCGYKKFQKSKYVQADPLNSILDAKEFLIRGRTVLFTGTPCMIAGVRAAIPEKYQKNLFCIDTVCHGVPSPELYRHIIRAKEKKENLKIEKIDFRDKSDQADWINYSYSLWYESGEKSSIQHEESVYFRAFLEGYIDRKSCFECRIRKEYSQGDITLADFWGAEKEYPQMAHQMDYPEGISAIIVKTEKGKQIINSIKNLMVLSEANEAGFEKNNVSYYQKMNEPKDREKFVKKALRSKDAIRQMTREFKMMDFIEKIRKMKNHIMKPNKM